MNRQYYSAISTVNAYQLMDEIGVQLIYLNLRYFDLNLSLII